MGFIRIKGLDNLQGICYNVSGLLRYIFEKAGQVKNEYYVFGYGGGGGVSRLVL